MSGGNRSPRQSKTGDKQVSSTQEYSDADSGQLFLEDTDKPLPEKINPATRYIHFKTIARGGKAIIQSCRDLHLGRTVCYKQLKPEFQSDEVEQVRFLREARVGAQLQHPNTVPMYELGRDRKGNPYFTMKLVHGYTLREVLDYRERYDLSQLLNIMIQVGQALGYAHSHGVLHRDIKPENILVGPFGEVLVMDWGLAKVWRREPQATSEVPRVPDLLEELTDDPIQQMTGLGNVQGTVSYMSPEQLLRDPDIGYSSDVFSFGVVLYEVLTGRTPEVAETVREMSEKVQHGRPAPPSHWVRWPIPELLDKLVMQCLATLPSHRPAAFLLIVRVLRDVD